MTRVTKEQAIRIVENALKSRNLVANAATLIADLQYTYMEVGCNCTLHASRHGESTVYQLVGDAHDGSDVIALLLSLV